MIQRRPSKPIRIGDVTVGGGAPIVIQSMTKTDTRDAKATIEQILALQECGCEIVRVAVPDRAAAEALPEITQSISIPLIADIHFDYRLAIAAAKAGVDGLRINPGNIGGPERVAAVVKVAKERDIPIRIGVNAGSLPPVESDNGQPLSLAERMVEAALSEIRLLESLDFNLIKVSLKAFDVPTTIEAYRSIAEKIPYPLHLGITEAGTSKAGTIRSSIGLGILLFEGIGDTLRISLTGDPCEEVIVGYEILKSLNLRQRGSTLVSCPTCGRTEANVIDLAYAVEEQLAKMGKTIKVAVMGCVVNGPGEAKDADLGIACGKGRGVIFKKGKILRTIEEKDFFDALIAEAETL